MILNAIKVIRVWRNSTECVCHRENSFLCIDAQTPCGGTLDTRAAQYIASRNGMRAAVARIIRRIRGHCDECRRVCMCECECVVHGSMPVYNNNTRDKAVL